MGARPESNHVIKCVTAFAPTPAVICSRGMQRRLLSSVQSLGPGSRGLLPLPSMRQHALQRSAARSQRSVASATGSSLPPPGEASRRVDGLFRRPAPLLTLERAVGEKHGVDGNLWESCRFGAQIYPDLPLASTWRDLLRRTVKTAGRAAEPGSVDPPPATCPAERWTVRTVAAQLRSRDQLRCMMLSAAGVGPDGEPRPGAARADALLFVSGSHPARRLPGAGRQVGIECLDTVLAGVKAGANTSFCLACLV